MVCFFLFQAEDGIRDLVRSRGLGDVYKRQREDWSSPDDKAANGNVDFVPWYLQQMKAYEDQNLSLIHI